MTPPEVLTAAPRWGGCSSGQALSLLMSSVPKPGRCSSALSVCTVTDLGKPHKKHFSRDDAVRMLDLHPHSSPEFFEYRVATLQTNAQLLNARVLKVVIREVQGLDCAGANNRGQDVAAFVGQVTTPQAGHAQKISKFARSNVMRKGDFCI